MKNKHWEAIYTVVEKMDELCKQLESSSVPQESALSLTENTGDLSGVSPTKTDQVDIVKIRSEIRNKLNFLKAELAENYKERDCYLILFPLVVHFDELIQVKYLNYSYNKLIWPLLQKELFQIDDGGVLFYETLDDLFCKPQTMPFIFEVYYFCLSNGFQGRYTDNPVKTNEYMKKLLGKIIIEETDTQDLADETGQIPQIGSFAKYYVVAVLILVAFYMLLYGYANSWKPFLFLVAF